MLGVEEGLSPRPPVEGGAYNNERDLPHSLLEAVDLLTASEPLTRMFGKEFVDLFAALKRFEHEQFMTVISPWEREHLLLNV